MGRVVLIRRASRAKRAYKGGDRASERQGGIFFRRAGGSTGKKQVSLCGLKVLNGSWSVVGSHAH